MKIKKEIAELIQQDGVMTTWARKVNTPQLRLTTQEKEISEAMNQYGKDLAERVSNGDSSASQELANFIKMTVEPQLYNAPDEILDTLFDQGSIGEFDDFTVEEDAKNSLIAHDANVNGGNVDKSYIDYKTLKPVWRNKQIETEVSWDKLRKGGYKTIADLIVFGEEAFKNTMFYDLFNIVDKTITKSIVSTGTVAQSAIDEMADYLNDRGESPLITGLSSLINPIGKMTGSKEYLSDEMKNEINKYGLLKIYSGCRLAPISQAKKLGDGNNLLPAKKVFGFAGKIGKLERRGSLRVYQEQDINKEVTHLKFAGFQYGMAITNIGKVAKITVQ